MTGHRNRPPPTEGPRRAPRKARKDGIALMVVMVVFIILYLVVFQLHYTTKLEEKLSRSRSADSQGSAALYGIALSIMGVLAEDYSSGAEAASSSTAGTDAGLGKSTQLAGGRGGGEEKKKEGDAKTAAPLESSPGTDPTAIAMGQEGGAAGGPSWHDHLGETWCQENSQSLNGITVKYLIEDNEGKLDINRIWDYAPSTAETLSETNEERQTKDGSKDEKASAEDRKTADSLLRRLGAGSVDSKSKKSSSTKNRSAISTVGEAGAAAEAEAGAAEEIMEFVPPTEERRTETVKMLARVLEMTERLNKEHGFDYKFQPPNFQILAQAIEQYAYERRSEPIQNFMHLTSELLNVLHMVGAHPEVYYGPVPDIPQGEEFFDANQEYSYQKDEFGDLVGEFIGSEDYSEEREMLLAQLEEMKLNFGLSQFASMPGFGRLGNPMTQNAKEYYVDVDEYGNEFIRVPPRPIGLKDLFTTHSTGKININTTSVPILYSLLNLIHDTERDGAFRAQAIALQIEAYRQSMQPEEDPADSSATAAQPAPGDNRPKRPAPKADEKTARGSRGSLQGLQERAGTLTAEDLAEVSSGENLDYETNYFTNLQQIKFIDGEDGGPDDFLTEEGTAVTTADLEQKTPLQKVIHDYQQVMVFGSTYFTAILKSKGEKSAAVKVGYLTLHRNVSARRIDVVQWKELQK